MRIAQVAPLFERVPPALYGGTERVVFHLTDELVRLGHDVTLFASGDSTTTARLVPCAPTGLRLDRDCREPLAWHLTMIERVAREAHGFDIVHFHTDQVHLPIARRMGTPHVTTVHGRLDLPELTSLFLEFTDVPLISISDAQRVPVPHANWVATVQHGLPPGMFQFRSGSGQYLAFLGRISPEKRVDRAIAIATALKVPLKIAAKVGTADAEYFDRDIRPLLDHRLVEFVGEIGDAEKNSFLGEAKALLFPIDWREPFGLVMIEALACGTPVVAFRGGSVPEVIEDGRAGFVVDTLEEAIDAAARIDIIDRRQCRELFERQFTTRRMAERYVAGYARVIDGTRRRRPSRRGDGPDRRSDRRIAGIVRAGESFPGINPMPAARSEAADRTGSIKIEAARERRNANPAGIDREVGYTSMRKRRTPTPGQLEAAIQGAREMPEAGRSAARVAGAGEDPLYPSGIDSSRENGGPRGSGYPPSRTSGGLPGPDDDLRGVEPEEAIKRDTAVFIPGTQRKSPNR
jgi:glycosyltransferase involved in cell wall biosynthesis